MSACTSIYLPYSMYLLSNLDGEVRHILVVFEISFDHKRQTWRSPSSSTSQRWSPTYSILTSSIRWKCCNRLTKSDPIYDQMGMKAIVVVVVVEVVVAINVNTLFPFVIAS
ncbi:hypothetical protein LOAG_03947 [Loa loa]|uniref:Uncharacterized protein n=1 Tax=Loa loa TaxID=7209 RepID=A0A1S0U555_LOALO|nr:hypothetical protein LOAG_03947 [Loa loa]EFO24535.1 hypothetical protein LOAG_03947 [Loa loa]